MKTKGKELAKFFWGFEAFHALFHAYLWLSGATFTGFGITATPTLSMVGTAFNGVIALALGLSGWKSGERASP